MTQTNLESTPTIASPPHPTLLEELDLRQDEVLHQLEELERRIEALLTEYTQSRSAAAA